MPVVSNPRAMRAPAQESRAGAVTHIATATAGSGAEDARPPGGNRSPRRCVLRHNPEHPNVRLRPRAAQKRRVARHLLCSPYVGSMTPTRGVTMPLNLDQYVGVHAAALDVRARRTELIANNLANADTPGYKARDLDFRAGHGARRGRERHAGRAPLDHPGGPHRRRLPRPMPPPARISSTARRWRRRSTATPSTRSSSRRPSPKTRCATRRR